MDLYREHILDHYRHPRHWGLKSGATSQATCYNPLCGDEVTVQLNLKAGRLKEMVFVGRGCAISMAAASLLSEFIPGRRVEDVQVLGRIDIEALLGVVLPPARMRCGLLVLEAVHNALPVSL